MKKSTIQLVKYYLKKFSCEWIEEDQPEDKQNQLRINYNVFQNKTNHELFRLDFYVSSTPQKGFGGLSIDTCISGLFEFPEGTDETEMQRLIRFNGCSILYSTLRGYISVATANFPTGCHMLPSIVMADVVNSIEKSRSKKRE